MRRTSLLAAAVLVTGALTSAGPAAEGRVPLPAAASRAPAPAPPAFVVASQRTVHLITGDTVRVTTSTDGRVESTLTAGPHAGGRMVRWSTRTSSYLVPMSSPTERAKLDDSLFDVSRLVRLHAARIPIVVTFRGDAQPAARRAVGSALAARGTTGTVRGSYSVFGHGLDARDLRAVSSIRLAGAHAPRVTGPSHDVTVHVRTGNGGPVQGAEVFVENVDDADTYTDSEFASDDGDLTVTVPDGNYAVLAYTSRRLVVAPEVPVTADSTVDLDLADATVKPHVTMAGYHRVEAVLAVGRTPAAGFPFDSLQFSGPDFYMRVQPTSGHVAVGRLRTGVTAKLIRNGSGPAQSGGLAVTADISDGVPDDLDYVHHERDFARVVQRLYANGPSGLRQTSVDSGGPYLQMFTGQEYDARVPGRRLLLLQASDSAYYQQTVFPVSPPGTDAAAQQIAVDDYPGAGHTYVVPFAHGPVGPGSERHDPFAEVVRFHGRLLAYLPMLSGAGSAGDSYVGNQDGDWSLRQGRRLVDRGHSQVEVDVATPARPTTYVLSAVSHPASNLWELSTRVSDLWLFHSRPGVRRPILLTPSYVPPTTMSGDLRPGRTGFNLRFAGARGHRVTEASFQISTDDGRHWRDVHVVRTGPNTFRVDYRNPRARGSRGYVSMRVTGRDAHGDAVKETAIRVYRLR